MNCTDAYREALTRDFQATAAEVTDRPGAAVAEVNESGPATATGTGSDGVSTER